jgi:ketosteroid isomerase-like protein
MDSADASAARAAIAEQIERFAAAFNSGDAETLLSTYSDDLLKLRQGSPVEPKSETARRLRAVFEKFDGRLEVDNVETLVCADLAVARGTFVVTLTPKTGGDSQIVRRRYLEIWRRESGRWRVFRTMDNSDE